MGWDMGRAWVPPGRRLSATFRIGRKIRRKLLKLALCAAISGAELYAQTALATVTGTITDATGAVVANAPVSLKNLETGQVRSGASSLTGNYTVSQLPIGDYDMTVVVP